tara:strand:- start:9 stop:677 length:669 start_codon:yes stop_codon:yes gene_type:complete
VKTIEAIEFDARVRDAEILSEDRFGPKVYRTADGRMIKLFRIKRLFSTARLIPYARRFERAAEELKARGIHTVEVVECLRVKGRARDAVVYRPVLGGTLRDSIAGNADEILIRFSKFFASLHALGVYFRAAHFANFIVEPGGGFAMIDISEAHFSRGALRLAGRVRNFRHLARHEPDRASLEAFGIARFCETYLEASRLDDATRARFKRAVAAVHPIFGGLS